MKCQDIRSAIDAASRREGVPGTVKAHLGGCPDCSRYADETSALLTLLSALPRVQTPADFEFKLRSRIARAKYESQGQKSFLERLWANSFTWGQAATVMAAIALVVAFGTIQLRRYNQTTTNTSNLPDIGNGIVKPSADPRVHLDPSQARQNGVPEVAALSIASTTQRPNSVRVNPRTPRISESPAMPAMSEVSRAVPVKVSAASQSNTLRFYNRERGQIVAAPTQQTFIGAEPSASSLAKTVVFVPSI
jgi:hypothetical protein